MSNYRLSWSSLHSATFLSRENYAIWLFIGSLKIIVLALSHPRRLHLLSYLSRCVNRVKWLYLASQTPGSLTTLYFTRIRESGQPFVSKRKFVRPLHFCREYRLSAFFLYHENSASLGYISASSTVCRLSFRTTRNSRYLATFPPQVWWISYLPYRLSIGKNRVCRLPTAPRGSR